MKIHDLIDKLSGYDPSMEVFVRLESGWDAWFAGVESVLAVDHSPSEHWFYRPAGDLDAEDYESVCINDDCTPALAITIEEI